ncbi:MAG: polyprenyl synthetase family protein [Thermoanaerobacteraceae bacterium]|nr:polyprenyl synthetase family protein [Thermoanaerobacteraceae bacterium]
MLWPGLEGLLSEAVATESLPLRQLLDHVLSGGKGLRPTLVRICAQFGPHDPAEVNRVAAAIELVHLASLIHDDILDGAPVRRHRPALHSLYGPIPAVLTGDYLFATAFALLAQSPRAVLNIVTATIRIMCEGEIEQRIAPGLNEQAYLGHIGKKTASLIGAACRSGGVLCHLKRSGQESLARFGWHLGLAYQMADDLLDLLGRSEELGKPCLQDLSQGIITLPVLRFLELVPQAGYWREKISQGLTPEEREEIAAAVRSSGCCEYAEQRAREQVDLAFSALESLPPCPARDELARLAGQVLAKIEGLDYSRPSQEGAEEEEVAGSQATV